MTVSFVRQLGAEPGVQLNPLRDMSGTPSQDNSDQVFGIVMRATRGRIDKPFVVDKGNVYQKLGAGEQVRISALNEAWVQVVEALNKGAYQAVVQRLVPFEKAKIKFFVVKEKADPQDGEKGIYEWEVSDELPQGDYLFAVKHLECFNDGFKVRFHAEEITAESKPVANKVLTLQICEPDGNRLYEFTGSLDVNAKDDYGQPYYLPDVIASQTDCVELYVGADATISEKGCAYGYTENGTQAWCETDTLVCFEEGGKDYAPSDYLKAKDLLQYSNNNYAYISSGGSRSPALITQLAQLAFDTNRQLRFDIPGDLNPEAAVAFLEQLNLSSNKCAHLMQAFWSPLKTDDPTGINPKGIFGVATLNIAFACARNAETNAKGFARKNYPIAGKDWPVNRTGIIQVYSPRDQEKSKLATAKINPVIYETYTSGGLYVFTDSLTCAPVTNSARKLIAVADMSTTIDDAVTRACKDYLQQPMESAIKRTQQYLTNLFEGAQASGWLVPSTDPSMGGAAWKFDVRPNEVNPFDRMDVSYWLRYVGTARQIFVTQTITK